MCGIVGIASGFSNGFSQKEANAFVDMLFLDTLRGDDSTGVFGVDKHSNVRIHKEASHGLDFLKTTEMYDFKRDLLHSGLFAVGHNRAATRGTVKDENAHPFWVDDKIVLVQNGTYKGSHKHHKDTEVDTEAVAHVISENANIETALKSINAAYALAWFNTETHSLYLIRNDERPLWFLETKSKTLMWASEPWMLTVAASRQGIEFDKKPESIDPYTLVTLVIDGNTWKRTDTKLNDAKYEAPRFQHEAANEFMGYNVTALPWSKPTNKKNLELHVFELIWEACKEGITTTNHAQYVVDTVSKLVAENANKEILVEFFDYAAGNKHKDCEVWHIFGKAVVPEGHPMEDMVFHTTLFDKSEHEVMEFVSNNGYTGIPQTPRLLRRSLGSGQVLAAAASYLSQPKPFVMENVH